MTDRKLSEEIFGRHSHERMVEPLEVFRWAKRVADLERERDELLQELEARMMVDEWLAGSITGVRARTIGWDNEWEAIEANDYGLEMVAEAPDYPSLADQLRPGWRDE